ncbi:MAG: class I SAM-dependent methyltransferase [Thermoproteota archaeon]|nr:class I SAM-dependent methyltransferase [Candidatus Brockarchaeota archaeon]MBO3840396.1 class I SAM-dependent methyltransferase [Candidatus Brockarchaeota archaeon]
MLNEKYQWDEIIGEALNNSLKLNIPSIRIEDAYVIYSVAYLTALKFGRLIAVDAGAGVGFSTIWMAKALYESGVEGKIYAIEREALRFRRLEDLVNKYYLNNLITPINGDALECIKGVGEELNLVFIDIDKEHYFDFFNEVKDKVIDGGVILAHNVKHHYGTVDAFLNEISKKNWKTIVVPTEEGVSISTKISDAR